jgi:Tfp pilus assembly protein PilF
VHRFPAHIPVVIALSVAVLLFGCRSHGHGASGGKANAPAARGDVIRNNAAARAKSDRALELIHKGNYKDARKLLDEALTLDPMYAPAMNNLGVIDFRTGRLYDAAWRFENAAKLMPHEPEPANNLGLVLEQAGKYAEAEKQYDAASAMDLRRVEFAANRARVRVRQGKMDARTRELLDYVSVYDGREEWVDWARQMLTRFVPPTTNP